MISQTSSDHLQDTPQLMSIATALLPEENALLTNAANRFTVRMSTAPRAERPLRRAVEPRRAAGPSPPAPPGRRPRPSHAEAPTVSARCVICWASGCAVCRSAAGVAAQWVLRRHFDDADLQAVRVRDPHLVEPPRLPPGRAHDGRPPIEQGAVRGGQVAHLDPQPDPLVRRRVGRRGRSLLFAG